MTVLPFVETKGLIIEDVDQLKETVRQKMIDVYNKVAAEMKAQLPPNYPGLVGFHDKDWLMRIKTVINFINVNSINLGIYTMYEAYVCFIQTKYNKI